MTWGSRSSFRVLLIPGVNDEEEFERMVQFLSEFPAEKTAYPAVPSGRLVQVRAVRIRRMPCGCAGMHGRACGASGGNGAQV